MGVVVEEEELQDHLQRVHPHQVVVGEEEEVFLKYNHCICYTKIVTLCSYIGQKRNKMKTNNRILTFGKSVEQY